MNGTPIPTETVELAAKALYTRGHHLMCDQSDPCNCYFQDYRRKARTALEAAAPALLAAETDRVLAAVGTVFERYDDHRLGWRPSRSDVLTDVRAEVGGS